MVPANGEIIKMIDGQPESKVYEDGRIECRAKDIKGQMIAKCANSALLNI